VSLNHWISFDVEILCAGATDDLQRVTQVAYSQMLAWGMSEKVGYLAFTKRQQEENFMGKPFSDYTAQIIDEEVRALLNEAYQRTKKLLQEKMDCTLSSFIH
jgi:AFG3 family protein